MRVSACVRYVMHANDCVVCVYCTPCESLCMGVYCVFIVHVCVRVHACVVCVYCTCVRVLMLALTNHHLKRRQSVESFS